MKTESSQLVDAKTLAQIMDLPVPSIRRYAREGRLPCYRINRLMRFDPTEVKEAIREGEYVATSTDSEEPR